MPAPPDDDIAASTVLVGMDGQSLDGLDRLVAALRGQTQFDFTVQLVGADEAHRAWAQRLAGADGRFKLGAPTATLRDLLGSGQGLAILLEPGGRLHPRALAWFGWAARHTEANAFICDAERIGPEGVRHDPQLRQAVDPEVLLQANPYGETIAVARERLCALFGDRPAGSWLAFELLLELTAVGAVGHVPFPLVGLSDDALGPPAQPLAVREQILRRHRAKHGLADKVDLAPDAEAGRDFRALWRPPSTRQSLHVVIPTRDNGADVWALVQSLTKRAAARRELSITIMDNGTTDPASLEQLARLPSEGIACVGCDEPFNWSRLNNLGARSATADIALFMNDDMLMLTDGWDDRLRGLLARPDVGIVGAKLLYPDLTIQHAGVLFGWRGRTIHDGLYEPRDAPGPGGRWQLRRHVSAVTGAFMAMRRAVFDELGGFDAQSLAIDYSDLDMCLRVRRLGLSVLYAPEIELIHHEFKSRGLTYLNPAAAATETAELAVMRGRWGSAFETDLTVHPAWRDVTLPFRLLSGPSAEAAQRHLLATSAPDPWRP